MERKDAEALAKNLELATGEVRQAIDVLKEPAAHLGGSVASPEEMTGLVTEIARQLGELRGLIIGEFEPWLLDPREGAASAGHEAGVSDEAVIGEHPPWEREEEG